MTEKPRHHTRRHEGTRGSSEQNRTSSGQPRRDKSKHIKCKFCSKIQAMKSHARPVANLVMPVKARIISKTLNVVLNIR